MNHRLLELALKRERLIERCGGQRERLVETSRGLRRLCAAGDRAMAAGRSLRRNPEWVIAASVALAVVRPKRAWRLLKSGFVAWRIWRAIRKYLPRPVAQ